MDFLPGEEIRIGDPCRGEVIWATVSPFGEIVIVRYESLLPRKIEHLKRQVQRGFAAVARKQWDTESRPE